MQIKTRVRQRCCWCGIAIIDQELENTAAVVDEDGNAQPFPVWAQGALVAQVGGTSWQLPFDPAHDALPDDCCAAIDPEVTV